MISDQNALTTNTKVAHFGEFVEQFSDCPRNDVDGIMREIDEGFDGLLQSFVCFDLADIETRMDR